MDVKPSRYVFLFFGLAALFACTKNNLKLKPDSPNLEGTLAVSAVFPTASGATWTAVKDADDRYYLQSLDVSVTGTCSSSVKKVKLVSGNYTLPESATCGTDGTFSWAKTFKETEQGDMSLSVVGEDATGTRLNASQSILLRIDTVGPPAPSLTSPASNPYAHQGATGAVTFSGNVSPDTVKLTGPGGVDVPISSNHWSYDVTLPLGGSTNYTFTATDFTGNNSVALTVTASWDSVTNLLLGDAVPGGNASDAGSGFSIEAGAGAPAARAVDGTSSFALETGFNNLTNQLRAQ